MKVFSRCIAAFLLLAMAAGLAGCGGQPAPAAPETIKIGGIGPLSPPGTPALGQELKVSMQIAIDEINTAGGLLGKKLELIFEDSQGTPEKGQAVMEKLITKDKVVAVAGEGHSSAALAEMEVAKRSNVPFVIAEAWSDTLTAKGYKNVFRVTVNNTMFTAKIIDFVKSLGFKQPAIVAEDSDWGIGNVKLLEPAFKNMGLQYKSIVIDRTSKDVTPQLLQIKAFKPDLLINMTTGVVCYLVSKQASEIGLAPNKGCLVFDGGADAAYPEIWETTKAAANYLIWQTLYHPKAKFSSLTQPFVDKYTTIAKRPPTYVALEGYDCILVIADAIKRAGATDGDKVITAMEQTKLTGTRGEIKFPTEPGVNYHNTSCPLLFMQYTDINQHPDKAEIVYPFDVATAKTKFPAN